MRKLFIFSIFFISILGLSACGTNDTEAPIIVKKIKAAMIFDQGDAEPDWVTYVNVSDNVDTEFSVTVDNTAVDMNTVGTFIISYNVTDDAGNDAEQLDVTVTIINP